MRIPIDPEDTATGPFSELLRLQTDFYTRLSEETLRYLRRLQGATAPAVPGTVLMPDTNVDLSASGSPGTSIELKLEVENRQRVHCVVTTMLSQMVSTSGVTWFPAVEVSPPSLLLAPGEVAILIIKLPLPANIPPGSYRGALMLQGFREGAVAVAINVKSNEAAVPAQSAVATRIMKSRPLARANSSQGLRREKKKKVATKRHMGKLRR